MGVRFSQKEGLKVKLHRSGEDYLKTILILRKQNGIVRSADVASHLKISKASVSRAMKLLREGGFLTMEEHKQLHLTELGASVSEEIFNRHRILNELLLSIGVPAAVAEQDACRMEHLISKETLERVKTLRSQLGGALSLMPPSGE